MSTCPAPSEDPGDNRVRGPHFARGELVTAPNGRRYRRQQLKESSGDIHIVVDPDRTADGLIDVGNLALTSTPNLVVDESESAEPTRSDWTYRPNTTRVTIQIRNRRLLDHTVTFWRRDDEHRMVEITPRPTR